jgi:hypothetical protein
MLLLADQLLLGLLSEVPLRDLEDLPPKALHLSATMRGSQMIRYLLGVVRRERIDQCLG